MEKDIIIVDPLSVELDNDKAKQPQLLPLNKSDLQYYVSAMWSQCNFDIVSTCNSSLRWASQLIY